MAGRETRLCVYLGFPRAYFKSPQNTCRFQAVKKIVEWSLDLGL